MASLAANATINLSFVLHEEERFKVPDWLVRHFGSSKKNTHLKERRESRKC